MHPTRLACLTIGMLLIFMVEPATAGFANFDNLQEGPPAEIDQPFTAGGITFFDPDAYLPPPDDNAGRFVIEQYNSSRVGPPFSPPNALTMTVLAPGPSGSGGRMGEFWATTGAPNTFVSMDIFANVDLNEVDNLLTLEAWWDGVVVADTSVLLDQPGDSLHTLSIDGIVFDTVRLFSSGEATQGAWFGMVDNVAIVPEPSTIVLLLTGSVLVTQRRGQQHRPP